MVGQNPYPLPRVSKILKPRVDTPFRRPEQVVSLLSTDGEERRSVSGVEVCAESLPENIERIPY